MDRELGLSATFVCDMVEIIIGTVVDGNGAAFAYDLCVMIK